MKNDTPYHERINAAYIALGGTALLCFALHVFIFSSVYFWLPATFLGLLLLSLVVRRSVRHHLFTLSCIVLLWIPTTAVPLLMIVLGKDLLRGILR